MFQSQKGISGSTTMSVGLATRWRTKSAHAPSLRAASSGSSHTVIFIRSLPSAFTANVTAQPPAKSVGRKRQLGVSVEVVEKLNLLDSTLLDVEVNPFTLALILDHGARLIHRPPKYLR